MADLVDKRLYVELSGKSHEEVVFPPYCIYDEEMRSYVVTAWNHRYGITPESQSIAALDGSSPGHDYFAVFLVNYLLMPKAAAPKKNWLSIHDLKGGVTFFRGPHALPTDRIVDVFGNDLQSLRRRCEELGGYPLDMADLSFGFGVIGAVHIALTYWMGDEDFPAEARVMVDGSLQNMPLDVIYALLCDSCVRIAGANG